MICGDPIGVPYYVQGRSYDSCWSIEKSTEAIVFYG